MIAMLSGLYLSACSNGFHLRNNVELPRVYQNIQLENVSPESKFYKAFRQALEEAGGKLQQKATTKIIINKLREGKRVVAYTKERKARIYLVFLKFEYRIQRGRQVTQAQRINLDRTFIYDANFALGKAEEEKQIRKGLYAEAARLILLRLQYSNESGLRK